MTAQQAMEITQSLGVLKDFPTWNGAALAKIAEMIQGMCKSVEEAEKLVDEMCRRYDAWPGPLSLRTLYDSLFEGPTSIPKWKGFGPPPKIDCERCRDTGYVLEDGRHIRCHCDAAATVEDRLLQTLDRFLPKKPVEQKKLTRVRDIAGLLQ